MGEGNLRCCSYFGDDLIDLQCMKSIKDAGGIVACPADAVQEIRAVADYVCLAKAGEGALREFAEWIVKPKIDPSEIKRRVDFALGYLQHLSVSENDIGKKVIVDDGFCYSVLEYTTRSDEETKLVSHREHVDIQVIVKGEEQMDIADVSRLTVKDNNYDSEDDVMFWNASGRMTRVTLQAGDYIILYPEIAHRGAIKVGEESQSVLKIVGKITA